MKKTAPEQKVSRPAQPPLPKGRLLLLLGGGIGLLMGLNGALLLLNLPAPIPTRSLAELHGALMLYGFLGTAITLERAVALQSDRKRSSLWAYASPALSGLGVILALIGAFTGRLPAGRVLPAAAWMTSMALLVIIYLRVWQRQQTIFVLIQGLGALAGFVGITLWGRGFDIPHIVPWWTAFIVLTIVGERLELARVVFASAAMQTRVLAEVLTYLVGLVATLFVPQFGYPLMGLALAALILDVGSHDIALRTIKTTGLAKFMAASMLAGYFWALVAAGIWIVRGPVYTGFAYDTSVHALTIGFALSMIMAHAPIIIPAVARRSVPYSPLMWLLLGSLQLGLLVRVLAGARTTFGTDEAVVAWQWGGAIDVYTVLAFVISTIALITWGSRKLRQK